jgi:CRISPR-associated protein Cas1
LTDVQLRERTEAFTTKQVIDRYNTMLSNPFLKALSHSQLADAWERVAANAGAAGVDGVTVQAFEQQRAVHLRALQASVLGGRYQASPLRECLIPKASADAGAAVAPSAMRRLAIPTVADRVLQTAVALALTPTLEREFADTSFAYRRGRSVQQAVARVEQLRDQGFVWVVDADIEAFFDSIPHAPLLKALAPFARDDRLLGLVRQWLTAPLLTVAGRLEARAQGAPQGSPLSPLLSNLYLDTLDDALIDADHRIVRFADDFVILCRQRTDAEQALELTQDVLQSLALRLNSEKTRIVDFNAGFKFLGVNFVRSLAVPGARGGGKPFRHAAAIAEPLDESALQAALREANALTVPWPAAPAPDLAPTETEVAGEAPPERPAEAMLDLTEAGVAVDVPAPATPSRELRAMPVLRTLYLLEQGARVEREGDVLRIALQEETLAEVGLPQVDLLLVFGHVGLTTPALQACLFHRVPVVFMARTGRLYGVARSVDAEPAALLRAQVHASDDPTVRLDIARALVRAKLINSRDLLTRWVRRRTADPKLSAQWREAALALRDAGWRCKTAGDLNVLRGLEGASAARYFGAARAMMPPAWGFGPRVAWPAPDPVNAMLSFGYSLLRANLLALVNAEGLNPQIGFLHADGHGHAALVSDLMEPFRAPVVDALVMDIVSRRRLKPDDFLHSTPAGADGVGGDDADAGTESSCRLSTHASRLFIHLFEERMQAPMRVRGPHGQREPVSWRHVMLDQVKAFAFALRHKHTFTPWHGG